MGTVIDFRVWALVFSTCKRLREDGGLLDFCVEGLWTFGKLLKGLGRPSLAYSPGFANFWCVSIFGLTKTLFGIFIFTRLLLAANRSLSFRSF